MVVRPGRPSEPGAAFAVLLACASLTPSLLPRAPLIQGVVTGLAAACGYGVGVFVAWCWRGLRDRQREPWPTRAVLGLVGAGAVAFVVLLALGVRWQREAHRLAGTDPSSVAYVLLTPLVAALVVVALVAAARALRRAAHRLADLLARRLRPSVARVLAVLLVGGLLWGLLSGVVADRALDALDATFSLRDQETPDGVERPTSALRSGSTASFVEWDDLGREGRTFVDGGPDVEQIEAVSGRPAMEPIRAYAGLGNADDTEDRARLAVDDLVRAGGLERSHLLVVTTTGTGWVEPSAASGFEYVTGGDSAIVALQYSHLPSWMSFVVDAERAREAGRALFDEVYGRWSALPLDERPELYVFGESLGSFGAEEAFSGEYDLANRTAGALLVGPPRFNPLYRSFVDDRDAGTPEIEPVYRSGRIIRFATRAERPGPDDAPWSGSSRVLYLQHASDPVTWWNADLLLERPDWLRESPGADVPDDMVWTPIVSFLQVSGDLAGAFSTRPGHGHNFSGEHAAAWVSVVQPDDWPPDATERLRQELRRFP